MKLPNFLSFEPLNSLKAHMGIPRDQLGDFFVSMGGNRLTLDELDLLTSGEGIAVTFDQLTVLEDGTLAYKDSRILLYIRDINIMSDRTADYEPRYHLSDCSTLKQMRDNGKIERYHIAAETTGHFILNSVMRNGAVLRSEKRRLSVCQNCLVGLAFDGFSYAMGTGDRERFVKDFTPERFFEKFPRSLHSELPQNYAAIAPINTYTPDWSEISSQVREATNWKCEKCFNSFDGNKRALLHVHHKNGLRNDNKRENLAVLCVNCHAKEPGHGHMRNIQWGGTKKYKKAKRRRW